MAMERKYIFVSLRNENCLEEILEIAKGHVCVDSCDEYGWSMKPCWVLVTAAPLFRFACFCVRIGLSVFLASRLTEQNNFP